jgi:hypothetical protein
MVNQQDDKFSIFLPFEIVKSTAVGADKYSNMRIKGIASTTKLGEDSDGETIEPTGMDVAPFMNGGTLNFHHLWTKDPLAIIGEPIKAEIRDGDLWVEGKLYSSSQKARDVYDLAEILEKDSDTRRLGFSIEGKALVRNPKNKKHILKSRITNLAITPAPKCKGTRMDIMKGGLEDIDFELIKADIDDPNGGQFTPYLVDVVDGNGVRRTVDKDFNIKVWPLDKAMDTSNTGMLAPEHVEHDIRDVHVPGDDLRKTLTKGQAYAMLLSEGIEESELQGVYEVAMLVDDVVIKAGEGSRGGKVIGHTKSGKPIYDTIKHPSHKSFNYEEENDLLRVHRDVAHKQHGSSESTYKDPSGRRHSIFNS